MASLVGLVGRVVSGKDGRDWGHDFVVSKVFRADGETRIAVVSTDANPANPAVAASHARSVDPADFRPLPEQPEVPPVPLPTSDPLVQTRIRNSPTQQE